MEPRRDRFINSDFTEHWPYMYNQYHSQKSYYVLLSFVSYSNGIPLHSFWLGLSSTKFHQRHILDKPRNIIAGLSHFFVEIRNSSWKIHPHLGPLPFRSICYSSQKVATFQLYTTFSSTVDYHSRYHGHNVESKNISFHGYCCTCENDEKRHQGVFFFFFSFSNHTITASHFNKYITSCRLFKSLTVAIRGSDRVKLKRFFRK